MILKIYVGDEGVWKIWGGNWCVIDNEVSGLCNVYEKKEENVWCGYKIFFVILVRCI